MKQVSVIVTSLLCVVMRYEDAPRSAWILGAVSGLTLALELEVVQEPNKADGPNGHHEQKLKSSPRTYSPCQKVRNETRQAGVILDVVAQLPFAKN